jgi:hypothetical protein
MTDHRFVKKLGDPRAIEIPVNLTQDERADRRKAACDLRDQQAALSAEAHLAAAGFRQRKKELENKEAIARGQASTGIELQAVVVQSYLTATNEVVAMRLDTNEPVARRTATGEELQEDLFGGEDDEEPSGKPS